MGQSTQHIATTLLRRHAETVSAHLTRLVDAQIDAPPRLIESIRYSLLAPGKRLRPALVLESFYACSCLHTDHKPQTTNNEASAFAAACAIELIHTFSLVHDDLPAMDDDDLRRGRPTNHKVFGEAMAILAGDAMVAMAFETLAHDADSKLAHRLIAELARATGPQGMIGGQVLDMDGENQQLQLADLQRLHQKKTGALLTTACRMGAICASADDSTLGAITRYGASLGVAFQIIDDLLDITATPEQLGKATKKDAQAGKNTYPALLGIEGSRAEAKRLLDRGIDALTPLGPSADGLRHLAQFIVERSM